MADGVVVYHGTSTVHLDSILREGLRPPVYFTPLYKVAEQEAMYTVIGDPCGEPFFLNNGDGGRDIVLCIDADLLNYDGLEEDREYNEGVAYRTPHRIPPEAIVAVISYD